MQQLLQMAVADRQAETWLVGVHLPTAAGLSCCRLCQTKLMVL